jgi:glutamyl-tRNA synthetase
MTPVRTRIAPSPTGYPHIGTIYQAWLDYAYAKKHNGQFIVRIEDTDQSRLVSDAEEKIYEALEWFGITPDESTKTGGKFGPYKQSQRLKIYQDHIQKLLDSGHSYHCFCSPERLAQVRKDMQKAGKPPMYDKHCLKLTQEEIRKKLHNQEKFVIRLKVPENQTIIVKDLIRGDIKFDSNTIDDQVLIKSDGFPTYHFAVVVDDHLMEITHAVRGEEWLPSSPKHILIYQALNWQPPIWVHTPTLRNPDKSKLSKRQGHTNVVWYKEQGFLPAAVLNFLSHLGWTHPEGKEIFSQEEFIKLFDFKDLSPAGPVFDETKLRWLNSKYIREKTTDHDLLQLIKQYLDIDIPDAQLKKLIPLIKERIEVLSQVNDLVKFLNPELIVDIETLKQQKQTKATTLDGQAAKAPDTKEIIRLLKALLDSLTKLKSWTAQEIEAAIRNLYKPEFADLKPREFFMIIRVATTGFPVTPPLFESIELLGKETTLKRISQCLQDLA